MDLDDAIRRQIGRDLGNEQTAISMNTLRKLSAEQANPAIVWKEVVTEAQYDPAQLEVIVQITQVWTERKGLGALDQIHASMDDDRTRLRS